MRRLLFALFALFAVASTERAAWAAEPMLDLTWDAPAGCPDRARVIAHVEELVGRRPPEPKVLRARGRVSMSTEPPRYHLELVVGDEPAPARTMSGEDCARLADAAALILALDIDPDALSRTSPAPPAPPPVATETVARPPAPAPKLRTLPPRARTLDAFLGARALFDTGSLPRTTLGLGATLEVAGAHWAVELGGAAFAKQFTVGGPRDGAGGAYVELATSTLHGCLHDLFWSIDLRGCVGGELGREATRGVSIRQPATSASVLGAMSAMARVRFWPKLVLSPTVGVVLGHPVNAPRIVIETYGTVFEPAAAFFRGFFGLEAQFL